MTQRRQRSESGGGQVQARDLESPPIVSRGTAYFLLALVVLILGINWPLLATGLESISPLWLAVFRLTGGTLTVLLFAAATGRLVRPPRQDYPIIGSVAVFRLALVFILVFGALEFVPPGRSSILVWTTSLWTVPLAAFFVDEHMDRLRWLGLIIGLGGIVLVFEPTRLDWTDGRLLLGHLMLLSAAALLASVSVHVRHHTWASTPLALLPWQLMVAALPMLTIALLVEGIPAIDWTWQLAGIVAFQATMASGVALWGSLTALRTLPAITTNLTLMAIPVIGLISSAVLVGESLTAGVIGGLILVLGGVGLNIVSDARTTVNPQV
ncbi:MAG: DMT family transporter [Acidimicrobiia bacterium]